MQHSPAFQAVMHNAAEAKLPAAGHHSDIPTAVVYERFPNEEALRPAVFDSVVQVRPKCLYSSPRADVHAV